MIVLAVFAVAGVACGWLWHQLWAPAPTGVAFEGKMYFPDDTVFRATGLYLLIAAATALALGVALTYLLDRDEVATLVAVIAGALLAGALMAWVGAWLGPESPGAAAAGFTDEPGEVTGALSVDPLARWTAFPSAAVAGSLFVLVTFNGRTTREPRSETVRHTVPARTPESTDAT